MGCLSVNITRVRSGVDASFTRGGGRITASFTPAREPINVRFGLVCGTDIGDGFLFASDGLLLTIENGKLKVRQR